MSQLIFAGARVIPFVACIWLPINVLSKDDHNDVPRVRELEALNSLLVGCTQEGSINLLLEHGGRRIELLAGGLSAVAERNELGYDDFRIIRMGVVGDKHGADGVKMCLYFLEGHLLAKCVIPNGDGSNAADSFLREIASGNRPASGWAAAAAAVFRREIISGRQHPSNDEALMERVVWGPSRKALPSMPTDNESARSKVDGLPREGVPEIRLGVFAGQLPPFANQLGYNALVVFQNSGKVPLNVGIVMMGVGGPLFRVRCTRRDGTNAEGLILPWGVYGTRSSDLTIAGDRVRFRIAQFRLNPGETSFMYAKIPELELLKDVSAESMAIGLEGDLLINLGSTSQPARIAPEK